jgi:hypothetical protein
METYLINRCGKIEGGVEGEFGGGLVGAVFWPGSAIEPEQICGMEEMGR